MSTYGIIIIVIYLISLWVLYLYKYIDKKIADIFAYLISSVAYIVAGLRPDYFPDVDSYAVIYEQASSGEFDSPLYWLSHGEPGFKVISYILHSLGFNYNYYLLFFAFLSYVLLIKVSKIANVKFAYVWFFYLSLFFITRDLGIIRLSIASHLIVIALCLKRIHWQIITLVFSSLFFQYYSIIAILPIFLSYFNFNLTFIRILFLFVCSFTLGSYVDFGSIVTFVPEQQLQVYGGTNMVTETDSSVLFPILRNLFFAILAYYLYYNLRVVKLQRTWLVALFLSVATYLIFSNVLILAQRFSAYYAAILPIAMAWILEKSNNNKKFNFVIFIFIFNFASLFYFNDFVWILN